MIHATKVPVAWKPYQAGRAHVVHVLYEDIQLAPVKSSHSTARLDPLAFYTSNMALVSTIGTLPLSELYIIQDSTFKMALVLTFGTVALSAPSFKIIFERCWFKEVFCVFRLNTYK